MLSAIIRFSLRQRALIAALALLILFLGSWRAAQLPIDVFPDLDRPRVTIMTEAHGLAPEEVETLVTRPIESAISGATGVRAVRSESGAGLSIIYVEFDWGTDIYIDRQIVTERLATVTESLPKDITPQLAPISSVMGQIMIIGMWSDTGDTDPMELRTLADWNVARRLRQLPGVSQVFVMGGDRKQFQVLVSPEKLIDEGVTLHEVETALGQSNENVTGGYLDDNIGNERLVRVLGRLGTRQGVPGTSENVIEDIKKILVKINIDKGDGTRPPIEKRVLIEDVAKVLEGPQVKRGDSSAWLRRGDGTFTGGPAIVMTVTKQPGADTREVTERVSAALRQAKLTLPGDVVLYPELYQQKLFIDVAIQNVADALGDGAILVVVVLFLFLLNFRTTLITLTAIPLSIMTTALIFYWFDLSINTMTLGGLAVAIGELVDDAIVDVENIFRRLKENRHLAQPKPALQVVFLASCEIRNSIVFGTAIVVLVFLPVFALSGMEGRLFTPLGIAYIVSILSSLVVSLTVTPVLSYWLLESRRLWTVLSVFVAIGLGLGITYWGLPQVCHLIGFDAGHDWLLNLSWTWRIVLTVIFAPLIWITIRTTDILSARDKDGPVLWLMKTSAEGMIRFSLAMPRLVLGAVVVATAIGIVALLHLENDFLPPFDEGVMQLNVILPTGTSLDSSSERARVVEEQLKKLPGIRSVVRKTGRAELDEHAVTPNFTEFICSFDFDEELSREEGLAAIRDLMERFKETDKDLVFAVDQPMQHLISHTLSGVRAQVAVKIFGEDREKLKSLAKEVEARMRQVPGVKEPQVERQDDIPQVRITPDPYALAVNGFRRDDINELVETAMNGEEVSEVLVGERSFDLLVRLAPEYRNDLETIKRLRLNTPTGGRVTLDRLVTIQPHTRGPNKIKREQVRRLIVVQCNTAGRGLVDVVQDIQQRLRPIEESMPGGYFIEYGGQFESQQSASRVLAMVFVVSLAGMFLVLHGMFRSTNLSLQVMISLPVALVGSVAAMYATGQTLSIAAMVGFISLCGIASRNGILLINHYLHLVKYEGEGFNGAMIVRAGRERVAPVLMTALTSGIGLVPLALAAGEPGKEILYPVATVIIGGLLTSTLAEFLVRPALFDTFGKNAADRVVKHTQRDPVLLEQFDDTDLVTDAQEENRT